MIKKLVRVILPAYKMGQFIGEAWESVGGQTYPFWEVLVGGDAGFQKKCLRKAEKSYYGRN